MPPKNKENGALYLYRPWYLYLPRLVKYGEILFDNFAILVGIIRQQIVRSDIRRSNFVYAFIHGFTAAVFCAKADKKNSIPSTVREQGSLTEFTPLETIRRRQKPLMFLTGFTLFEILITLFIIAIVAGAMVPMFGYFGHYRQLEDASLMLFNDLIQTQQFARVQRDGYQYYGLRFFGGLGPNIDRCGYKIVRYEPKNLQAPFNPNTQGVKIIKSSQTSDNPEFLENTFFGPLVSIIDANSELAIGDSIVFITYGSATSDGLGLLNASKDSVNLSLSGNRGNKIITITPLTGNVQIQ